MCGILCWNVGIKRNAMRIIDLSQDQFYGDDKSRDLIDDLIRVINLEILSLAKHGCKHIQLDEPVLMRYPKKALEYGVTDVIKCFEGMSSHRGLKLDGAIGQGEICNSLKSENFSKSFLSHIGKNRIKF